MQMRDLVFVLFLLLMACQSQRESNVFTDVQASQKFPAELIETSPYIVVANVETRVATGPSGLMPRSNGLPPFPAQKMVCRLKITAVLRGDLAVGKSIEAVGYETSGGQIGAPTGICAAPGSQGIYFLRKNADVFRVMVDEYTTAIALDPRADLSLADGRDIPLSIWKLLIFPYEHGWRKPDLTTFALLEASSGSLLGRSRTIELLSSLASESKNPDLQVSACLWLNEAHRGCGGESCLQAIASRSSSEVSVRDRERLLDDLQKVPIANAKLRTVLASGTIEELSDWARSKDPQELKRFLGVLAKHPDASVARLAAQRLASMSHSQ